MTVHDIALEKARRGRGTGSRFFFFTNGTLDRLFEIKTSNRMNLVLTYLTLSAGTGSDHRLTKWSTKACEDHLGIGKPRGKLAIAELMAGGLVAHTPDSTAMRPQYELEEVPHDEEVIFLPVQIVTGFGKGDNSVLRRIRETGDPLLLRMLLDLYGLVSVDATKGVPIRNWSKGAGENDASTTRKICEIGPTAIWGINSGECPAANGEWAQRQKDFKNRQSPWTAFWDRLRVLRDIGVIYEELWLFESEALDAEPLMPLADAESARSPDAVDLAQLAADTSFALAGDERPFLFEKGADFWVPMALHRPPPVARRILRLTVEADSPANRAAHARRKGLIEDLVGGYERLLTDAAAGRALLIRRPMKRAC